MALDTHTAYRLHPQVALRPEPFGALAYHYGNRRLVFLKTPKMVDLVRSLEQHGSLGEALDAAGVPEARRPRYLEALDSLRASDILVTREDS